MEGGINTYAYALQNPGKYIDLKGLDVCTYRSAQGYEHEWIEINGDVNRSYGWWPVETFGKPGRVLNPDPRSNERNKPGTEESCTDSSAEEDKELEDWIKANYDVFPNSTGKNPNYNPLFENCRDFVDDVNDKLDDIKNENK